MEASDADGIANTVVLRIGWMIRDGHLVEVCECAQSAWACSTFQTTVFPFTLAW